MNNKNRKTILLVEDEVLLCANIKMSIENYGYTVITAGTGMEAIEAINKNPNINLVLMDIDLGEEIDGTETAEIILKDHDIPIVFLSNHTEPSVVAKTEKISSYGYTEKTSSMTVLDASIKMAFKLFDANQKLKNELKERKQTEKLLRESEALYAQTIAAVNDGIWDLHIQSGNAFFSPLCYAILGYKDNDFTATYDTWKSLVHPEDIDRTEFYFQKTIKSGKGFTIDLRMKTKSDEWLWISMRGNTVEKDVNGTALRMIGTLSNITNRKLIEKKLKESEARYKRLFETAAEGILVAGVHSKIILFTNPAICKMFGYTKDEFLKLSVHDIHPEESIDHVLSEFEAQARGEKATAFDLPCLRKDGSIFFSDINTALVELDGQDCNVGFFTNITERKLAEDKIKSLLIEKEIILKEVHHRIKNNMNAISTILYIQGENSNNRAIIDALEDARNRIHSMMVLYDKLYLSNNYNEISMKVYLSSLVDQIINNFPNSNSVKTEKFIDDFDLELKKLQPLGIIVNELLTNIMKYAFIGKSEGIIVIETSVKASAKKNGKIVYLMIQDNGIGLPEAIDFEKSTGFGMELVKMLTKQLKGIIQIEREKGTKFTLEFEI